MTSRPIIICMAVVITCGCGHTSDATLRAAFRSHKAALEELRGMLASGRDFILITKKSVTTRVMTSDPTPDGLARIGLSPAKYAHYARLLDAIGLNGGLMQGEDGVWFEVDPPSFKYGDSRKGFAYSTAKLGPTAPNLDAYVWSRAELDRNRGVVAYSVIEPHWYLYKQVN